MKIPERLLLGPGPSPVAARVMAAMAQPVLSHLDPEMMRLLDDLRRRLTWVFGAEDGASTLAISGTGTAGMEAAVANVMQPGMSVLTLSSYAPETDHRRSRRRFSLVEGANTPR